jgi:DNA invertase Pin-like site-specific DNA recombinase
MIYGYARVSTDGRASRQVAQLTDAGAVKVFRETAGGAKTDRRALARAIKALEAGDTLLVTRLDRQAKAARAKALGQHMGRPPKLTGHQRSEAVRRREKSDETLAEIDRTYNVSPQTIGRLTI